MVHSAIYDWFAVYFPQFAEHVELWKPNGRNSILIRQTNKLEFIFTFNSTTDWSLETVKSYLRRKE